MSLLSVSAAPPRLGAALLLVVSINACSPAQETAADSSPPAAPSAPSSALDLARLDVCSRVPAVEVAALMGAEASRSSGSPTMSEYASDCTYTLGRADGHIDTAILWVYPPTLWESELGSGDRAIDGLGDSAFLRPIPQFEQVHVLVEGDVYIDARAKTEAWARALAELALRRLVEAPERSSAG